MDSLLRLIAEEIGPWTGQVLSVFGGISLLVWWGVGWRYVLSPRFRAAVRAHWSGRSRMAGGVVFIFGLFFFVVVNCAIVLLVLAVILGSIKPWQ